MGNQDNPTGWDEEPFGYPREHGPTRQCIECGYHPIVEGQNCPNCGRKFDGTAGSIPKGRTPRARQGEGVVDDFAEGP